MAYDELTKQKLRTELDGYLSALDVNGFQSVVDLAKRLAAKGVPAAKPVNPFRPHDPIDT